MVNKKCIYLFLCSLIFMFLSFFINVKIGKAIKGACSDCHTMHNSQNGTAVVSDLYRALTIGDCVYCHSDSGPEEAPTVVSKINKPDYTFGAPDNVTAGGDFYWVINEDDAKGHNVNGTGVDQDDYIGPNLGYKPPGYVKNYGTYGRNHDWDKQLTCAGTYGCHGDPSVEDPFGAISGAHHGNELCNSTAGNCDGNTTAKSYRFLLGILGTEDDDWELTLSKDNHNGYYAEPASNPFDNGSIPDEHSINYLCGECHGQFHYDTNTGSYGSPWLRHPTDYDMNKVKNKEYGNYPGIFNGTLGTSNIGDYFAEVPVGTDDGSVVDYIWNTGDAIVLCISCHRAHGTPYDDILRWNYKDYCEASPNGTNQNKNCGCFACHTSK